MSDAQFERRLHELFNEAPARPDAELFAAQVRDRLERDWTFRRLLIGVAGAGGGVLAVWRLAGSEIALRFEGAVRAPLEGAWRDAMVLAGAAPALRALPVPVEVFWLAGGLMLLAAGMVVTRVVDEL